MKPYFHYVRGHEKHQRIILKITRSTKTIHLSNSYKLYLGKLILQVSTYYVPKREDSVVDM